IRSALTCNARQLALGLMMYAQDHDGMLPSASDNIRDLVMPYVKSEPLFDGLVYQYAGGPLNAITEPAKTLLGYVAGPGGRANLFADGHAAWQRTEERRAGNKG